MTKDIFVGYLIVFLIVFAGCKDENLHRPITSSNGIPDPVRNVRVENIHGGAQIYYDLPSKAKNILLVKVVVKEKDGSQMVKKSSSYKNEITLLGFKDTMTYNVELYAVNYAQKESIPVNVKIKPLTPPILYVFNSLELSGTFGGVNIAFKNKYSGKVKIGVVAKDSVGKFAEVGAYYTQENEGSFSVNGFPPQSREFGAYVRDNFDHYSDTVFKNITPLFEQEIPKSGFSEVRLPTDTYDQNSCCGSAFSNLWDGVTNTYLNIFATVPGSTFPQWFTIDLGAKVRLSRFVMYSRADPGYTGFGPYSGLDPEVMELWGSLNPNPDGSFDSTWHLLGHFKATKPSGLPSGQISAEDVNYAVIDGQNFVIQDPQNKPLVKYIRFKTIDTWTDLHGNGVVLDELTFFGQIVH